MERRGRSEENACRASIVPSRTVPRARLNENSSCEGSVTLHPVLIIKSQSRSSKPFLHKKTFHLASSRLLSILNSTMKLFPGLAVLLGAASTSAAAGGATEHDHPAIRSLMAKVKALSSDRDSVMSKIGEQSAKIEEQSAMIEKQSAMIEKQSAMIASLQDFKSKFKIPATIPEDSKHICGGLEDDPMGGKHTLRLEDEFQEILDRLNILEVKVDAVGHCIDYNNATGGGTCSIGGDVDVEVKSEAGSITIEAFKNLHLMGDQQGHAANTVHFGTGDASHRNNKAGLRFFGESGFVHLFSNLHIDIAAFKSLYLMADGEGSWDNLAYFGTGNHWDDSGAGVKIGGDADVDLVVFNHNDGGDILFVDQCYGPGSIDTRSACNI
jgi:hypothetical protein